jgi:hypothetical protein
VSETLDGQAVRGPLMKTAGSCPETTWQETIDLWARAVNMTVGAC